MKESEAVYKAYHIWKTKGADPLTLYDAFVAGVEYFKTNGGFVIPDTQGQPCHLCGEPIDHFAGNPSKWGTVLSIGCGIPKPHHKGCIQKKLHELEQLRAERAAVLQIIGNLSHKNPFEIDTYDHAFADGSRSMADIIKAELEGKSKLTDSAQRVTNKEGE